LRSNQNAHILWSITFFKKKSCHLQDSV